MNGISPQDRLWLVNRDQAERRRLTAADHIAAAARDERRGRKTEAAHSGRDVPHGRWTTVSHMLRTLAHPHVHVPMHRPVH